ncbi:FMN-binding protein [Dethiobacter alkaliphilus]|uniref:FMN-binding domain protein n=1 Tax=Dethiobacter alkaliphilus AHT 1 TaxID=555088 RepID=C0GDD8_DETAL|nr:FMN-binding protein [Dethiobacter alkaliphilus]EEG78659.1 FMN-binding domain protein [Dethiobacter alkaliphilus AHT 1]
MRIKWWMIVMALVLLFPLSIGFSVWQGIREIQQMEVYDVSLTELADGIYTGRQDTTGIKVEVSVDVSDGRITAIDILEHENGRGSDAEVIVDDVIAAQSLSVDSISGATLSSTVILKAVEEALLQTSN